MAACVMASTRSAGGGPILRATAKATALSFQSVITSADAAGAMPNRMAAARPLRWLAFMAFSPDCGASGRVRQISRQAAGKYWASSGKIQGNEGQGLHMAADLQFSFGPFRFEARTGELWRDGAAAKLTPRAAAVLATLARRAGQLVTKQELFDEVWGGMAVSDD